MGNKLDLVERNQKQVANLTREMKEFVRRNSARNPIAHQFLVSAKAEDRNLSTCLEEIIDHLITTNSPAEGDNLNDLVSLGRSTDKSRMKMCGCKS